KRELTVGLPFDGQAQTAGRALDNSHGVIDVSRVEVLQLPLRYVTNLRRTHLEALVLAAALGLLLGVDDLAALFLLQRDAGCLLEQHGRWRTLDDEFEAAVRVHGDHHGQRDAAHLLGSLVELRHELSDIHTVLTERRADGGRGRRLPSGYLELDL